MADLVDLYRSYWKSLKLTGICMRHLRGHLVISDAAIYSRSTHIFPILNLQGVVVQCINHSPITQEPSVHFQVETMQSHKQLNKLQIKAAQ